MRVDGVVGLPSSWAQLLGDQFELEGTSSRSKRFVYFLGNQGTQAAYD